VDFITKTIIKGDKRMANVNEKAIEAFLTKIKDDNDFAQKICETNEPGDVQNLAKEAGVELTIDDIMASKEIFHKAADKANQGELSDEDLENVAGGIEPIVTVALITLAGVCITAAATLLVQSMKTWKW